ncbi:MAG: hypothetical protein LBR28_02460 [Bacteroidales bacterium]|jgi:hypothetical protein|nr:hypothetical protein [Bacteroidales bacterium]
MFAATRTEDKETRVGETGKRIEQTMTEKTAIDIRVFLLLLQAVRINKTIYTTEIWIEKFGYDLHPLQLDLYTSAA